MWNIDEKIVAFVVDNARNMCNAINLTGFNLINCAAHTIQLAIHDAIDNNSQLQIILAKCRAIVGHFKRSNIDKFDFALYFKIPIKTTFKALFKFLTSLQDLS